LCEALPQAGVEPKLLTVAAINEVDGELAKNGYQGRQFRWDHAHTPILKALRRSRHLARSLNESVGETDIVHNHGLWLMPNVYAGRETARAGTPLVVSPRGMLGAAALAFSRRKKKLFWALLQGPALRHAACFHATSEAEYDEIRAFGIRAPIAVIPNGIDLPQMVRGPMTGSERVVLSLGRLHPKKGLDRLLRAWAVVEPGRPDWLLRIIGPSEAGHDNELRALAASLHLQRVSIEAPLYDEEKDKAYRLADLFVLPTHNENFGVSVAEALAAEVPVIVTKGAPWRKLKDEDCGWWIDHGVEPLAAALSQATSLPREQLEVMGARGRAWMAREYSWVRTAHNVSEIYSWLCVGSAMPATVRTR
jgi:glycosyltransferase involved in cell wall biosynthesis